MSESETDIDERDMESDEYMPRLRRPPRPNPDEAKQQREAEKFLRDLERQERRREQEQQRQRNVAVVMQENDAHRQRLRREEEALNATAEMMITWLQRQDEHLDPNEELIIRFIRANQPLTQAETFLRKDILQQYSDNSRKQNPMDKITLDYFANKIRKLGYGGETYDPYYDMQELQKEREALKVQQLGNFHGFNVNSFAQPFRGRGHVLGRGGAGRGGGQGPGGRGGGPGGPGTTASGTFGVSGDPYRALEGNDVIELARERWLNQKARLKQVINDPLASRQERDSARRAFRMALDEYRRLIQRGVPTSFASGGFDDDDDDEIITAHPRAGALAPTRPSTPVNNYVTRERRIQQEIDREIANARRSIELAIEEYKYGVGSIRGDLDEAQTVIARNNAKIAHLLQQRNQIQTSASGKFGCRYELKPYMRSTATGGFGAGCKYKLTPYMARSSATGSFDSDDYEAEVDYASYGAKPAAAGKGKPDVLFYVPRGATAGGAPAYMDDTTIKEAEREESQRRVRDAEQRYINSTDPSHRDFTFDNKEILNEFIREYNAHRRKGFGKARLTGYYWWE